MNFNKNFGVCFFVAAVVLGMTNNIIFEWPFKVQETNDHRVLMERYCPNLSFGIHWLFE